MSTTVELHPTKRVEPSENPLKVMQNLAHRTNKDLGFVVRDVMRDELHSFRYEGNGIWLRYHCASGSVYAVEANDMSSELDLFAGIQVVAPVEVLPHWGEHTVPFEKLLE